MTDLPGTFTVIDPAKLASASSSNPIAQAHYQLLRELVPLAVPQIGINPMPEEFEDMADYLTRVATIYALDCQCGGEAKRRHSEQPR